jgi:hypothetical protein
MLLTARTYVADSQSFPTYDKILNRVSGAETTDWTLSLRSRAAWLARESSLDGHCIRADAALRKDSRLTQSEPRVNSIRIRGL